MKTLRSSFRIACIVVCLGCVAHPSRGQSLDTRPRKDEIAKGYLPYHRLVAEDFPINDRVHPESGMYTWAFFHYNYHFIARPDDGRFSARVTDWTVRSGFDRNKSSRKSWLKGIKEVLPHEQGHLDLGELHHRQLAKTSVDKLPVGKGATAETATDDLKNKLKAMADGLGGEGQAEQDKYDAETAHGRDRAKQRAWEIAIQKRLIQAGITFSN